jgi:hypothetical protein
VGLGRALLARGIAALGEVGASRGAGALEEVGSATASAAESAIEPTIGKIRLVTQQLEGAGRGALEKSVGTWTRRLAEHVDKLQRIKAISGYTSKVETEIRNFLGLIQTAKDILEQ